MTVTKGRGRGSRNAAAIAAAVNAKVNRSSSASSYIDMGAVAELYANLQAEFALSGGEVSSSLQSVPGPNEQTRIQADIGTLLTHIEDRLSTCSEELSKVKRIGDVVQEEKTRRKKRIKREFGDDEERKEVDPEGGSDGDWKIDDDSTQDDTVMKVKKEEDDEKKVKLADKALKSNIGKSKSTSGKREVDSMDVDDDEGNVTDSGVNGSTGNFIKKDIKRGESVDSEPDLPLADEVMAISKASAASNSDVDGKSTPSKTEDIPIKTDVALSSTANTSTNIRTYDLATPAKHSATDFAEIQAASIAALGLFDESITVDSDGNPIKDVEILKKKYGVASFPEHNLKDLLPGEIPDEDFTRAKPANQVQFSTFATYIEPCFRPLTEEDISFLKHKSVGLDGAYTRSIASPYLIPPLGPLYTDSWAEEDGPVSNSYSLSPPPSGTLDESLYKGRGSSDILNDDILEAFSTKVSVGPLASRLLSALLREPGGNDDDEQQKGNEVKVKTEEDGTTGLTTPNSTIASTAPSTTNMTTATSIINSPSKPASAMIEPAKSASFKTDYSNLEERLKREFRYVGILDVNLLRKEDKKNKRFNGSGESTNGTTNSSTTNGTAATNDDDSNFELYWANSTEDDEICYEIRKLQKKFRQVTKMNQACKRALLPIVQEQMAYQEYAQILEDLDKQVDQAYLKRMRSMPKGKKKKGFAANTTNTTANSTPNSSTAADQKPPSYKPLLEKRLRWIEKIGAYFKPAEIMKRTPNESIFANIQIDDDEDDVEPGDDDDDMYNMTL